MYNKEIFSSEVSPLAKLVYIWLWESGSNSVVVSNADIAEKFGRSVVHISGVLGELEDAGYISMAGRRRRVISLL